MKKKQEQVTDYLSGQFVKAIGHHTPVENGHAHEAWVTAAEEVAAQLPRSANITREKEAHSSTKASGDLTAAKHGKGRVSIGKKTIRVRMTNRLPFVYKMEHGLPITVGVRGRTGTKSAGRGTEGELYAPRLSSPVGHGWLFWTDAGGEHFAKVRTEPPTLAFAKSIEVVKHSAKRYASDRER